MNQVYVQCVLGIKLHKKRNTKNSQGQYHRSMTAKLWQQGVAGYQEVRMLICNLYFFLSNQITL